MVEVPDADENDDDNDGGKDDASQKTLEGLAANESLCAASLCSVQSTASLLAQKFRVLHVYLNIHT